MELDGMKERMTMGVKARLKAGKANTGQDRDGYRRVGETIEIVEEEEARWIKLIFEVLCYCPFAEIFGEIANFKTTICSGSLCK